MLSFVGLIACSPNTNNPGDPEDNNNQEENNNNGGVAEYEET